MYRLVFKAIGEQERPPKYSLTTSNMGLIACSRV